MTPAGFPHSDISGSTLACSSPKLFAACHVLPRRSVPRHPPCALTRLTSFPLASRRNSRFGRSTGCSSVRLSTYARHTKAIVLLGCAPKRLAVRKNAHPDYPILLPLPGTQTPIPPEPGTTGPRPCVCQTARSQKSAVHVRHRRGPQGKPGSRESDREDL